MKEPHQKLIPPIFTAAANGEVDSVRCLLDRGAAVDQANNDGMTVLHIAAKEGHKRVVIELLDHAVMRGNIVSFCSNHTKLTQANEVLFSTNKNDYFKKFLNQKDNHGRTALHIAAWYGYKAVVRLLLDSSANVNQEDETGMTALYIAVEKGHEAVVRLLLDRGADINAATNYGWTALYRAAYGGHKAVVGLLLDNGAKVNQANNDGRTALHWAAQKGHEAVVRLLLKRGANIDQAMNSGGTALSCAAEYGHEAVVRLLLEQRAKVNQANNYGGTALHAAARYGHETVVRLLLDRGADINAATPYGWTALYVAAQNGRHAVVRLLLDNGAAVERADEEDWTALLIAAYHNKDNVVRLLLDRGADINTANNYGRTALHWAAQEGHKAVFLSLLLHGADTTITDKDSKTALDRADEKIKQPIKHILIMLEWLKWLQSPQALRDISKPMVTIDDLDKAFTFINSDPDIASKIQDYFAIRSNTIFCLNENKFIRTKDLTTSNLLKAIEWRQNLCEKIKNIKLTIDENIIHKFFNTQPLKKNEGNAGNLSAIPEDVISHGTLSYLNFNELAAISTTSRFFYQRRHDSFKPVRSITLQLAQNGCLCPKTLGYLASKHLLTNETHVDLASKGQLTHNAVGN